MASFCNLRLLPFLDRRSLPIVLCLIAIASLRIVATYPELSLTVDEPAHFACGLEYIANHVYRYETQHPPLGRAMVALGPYLDGARPRGDPDRLMEAQDVMLHSGHPDRTLALMRLGILPFFWLACGVLYGWARRYFGKAVAVIALGLFTIEPTVLAHAGLATTDMALAACLAAAFFSLVVWAESPTWKHSLLLGVTAAMAALSKFTALGFLPTAAMLALIFHLAAGRHGWKELAADARRRAPMFALAMFTGALLIWAGYWFSFGKVPEWNLRLPAPEFFDGISVAATHTGKGHPAFLLGEFSDTGWWYYFPVALAVKTPIAFLALLSVGAWVCWRNRAKSGYLLPLAFALGVLLPAMAGRVNIGVRHVLPVYMAFAMLAALGLVHLAGRARSGTITLLTAGLLVIWMAASGAIQHPDYLAYFNAFAGGKPYLFLSDSNLDWGQDLKRLARRLRQLGAKEVGYAGFFDNWNWAPLRRVYGLPPVVPLDPAAPTAVWTAVSPNRYYERAHLGKLTGTDFASLSKASVDPVTWWTTRDPTERVGALLLYQVQPSAVQPP